MADWAWLIVLVIFAVSLAAVLAITVEKSERAADEQAAKWAEEDREWAGLDEEEEDDELWHPDRDAAYPIEQWHEGDDVHGRREDDRGWGM